jgi:hypothetical protein
MLLEFLLGCFVIVLIAYWMIGDPRVYFGLMGLSGNTGTSRSGAESGGVVTGGVVTGRAAGSIADSAQSVSTVMSEITGKLIKVYRDDDVVTRTVLGGIDAFDKDGKLINSGLTTTYGPPSPDGPTSTELDLRKDTVISKIVVRNRSNGFLDRINGCRLVVTNASGVPVFRSKKLSGSNETYTFIAPFDTL